MQVTRVVKFIRKGEKGDKGDPGKDGVNYLMPVWWDEDVVFTKTPYGVPTVKVEDGSTLGFSVYALLTDTSTAGLSPAASPEWRLLESSEYMFILDAYIERLQAALVTAEKIESIHVKTSLLEVLNGAKIGDFTIQDGALRASHFYMAYLPSGAYVQVTGNIRLSSGGLVITSSYGGTLDHPQVVSWNTEITSAGIKVGDMEMRRNGIYRNGTLIL